MKHRFKMAAVSFLFLLGSMSHGQESELGVQIGGLYSSFSANFSYSSDEGALFSGKIQYEYPDKAHIKLSDGRVIATNGAYLWLYSPESMVCAKQKVEPEKKSGIFNLLKPEYLVSSTGSQFVFEKEGGVISELVLDTQNNMIKNARIKMGDKFITLSFSNVEVNIGLKASLFNYKPPTDAQVVENPFNKIALRGVAY